MGKKFGANKNNSDYGKSLRKRFLKTFPGSGKPGYSGLSLSEMNKEQRSLTWELCKPEHITVNQLFQVMNSLRKMGVKSPQKIIYKLYPEFEGSLLLTGRTKLC